MKRADLEALGLEKETIDKIMALHGADIEAKKKEYNSLNDKLTEANNQLNEAQEKLKDVDSKDETINTLQKQMEDYIKAENERKAKEEADRKDRELTEKITALFEGKEFTSDYVRNGLIADIKGQHAQDSTVGLKEIFENLTKDKEGIFKNPQHEKLNIPPTSGNSPTFTREDIKKMSTDEINKNWDAIKETLKQGGN